MNTTLRGLALSLIGITFLLGPTSVNAQTQTYTGTLQANQVLAPGTALFSPSGQFQLWMQTDGNLVLYDVATWEAMWSTNTYGYGLLSAIMQEDGDFVLYDQTGSGHPYWASNTGYSGSSLYME